jgi:hypothetical protein
LGTFSQVLLAVGQTSADGNGLRDVNLQSLMPAERAHVLSEEMESIVGAAILSPADLLVPYFPCLYLIFAEYLVQFNALSLE